MAGPLVRGTRLALHVLHVCVSPGPDDRVFNLRGRVAPGGPVDRRRDGPRDAVRRPAREEPSTEYPRRSRGVAATTAGPQTSRNTRPLQPLTSRNTPAPRCTMSTLDAPRRSAFSSAACSDPGIVYRLPGDRGDDDAAVRYCARCDLERPCEARHCYECQLCVNDLDHHCAASAWDFRRGARGRAAVARRYAKDVRFRPWTWGRGVRRRRGCET